MAPHNSQNGPLIVAKMALFLWGQNGPIKMGPSQGQNFGPILRAKRAKMALLKLLCIQGKCFSSLFCIFLHL
jgi:hypothetical protein